MQATENFDEVFAWQETLHVVNGNPNLALKIIAMFQPDLTRAQQAVNSAVQNNDWKRVSAELHKLHGSCSYCVAPRLSKIIRACEEAITEQDSNRISALLDTFNQAANQLQLYLQNFKPA